MLRLTSIPLLVTFCPLLFIRGRTGGPKIQITDISKRNTKNQGTPSASLWGPSISDLFPFLVPNFSLSSCMVVVSHLPSSTSRAREGRWRVFRVHSSYFLGKEAGECKASKDRAAAGRGGEAPKDVTLL